jgi:glucose/arabinose dehydrogenase/mono/diheme cytochrome c family protein
MKRQVGKKVAKKVNRLLRRIGVFAVLVAGTYAITMAQDSSSFHNAPASVKKTKSPVEGSPQSAAIGGQVYATNCAACHGPQGQGTGNVPALKTGPAQSATEGELFWFVTKGDEQNGMPSWASLSAARRWQVVAYLKSGLPPIPKNTNSRDLDAVATKAPPPKGDFTDFRYEAPGKIRKISVQELPAPFATTSAGNAPNLVPRPQNAFPKAPAGFKVDLYASELNGPRLIRTAPNGDYFVAESMAGNIKVFRGITGDSKPQQVETFASGLNRPYGIAFYPPGPNPQWVYIGNTDSVVRFPYKNGDMKASGQAGHIVDLPSTPDFSGHWTRSVEFSPDGKTMFVAVGSVSNVNDSDVNANEKNRADILAFAPDGSEMRIYAAGIRNAGGGIAVNPKTGDLWCSVNERDGLGDNLVPDYITHVQDGGFYGWPWWYMGGHQDPRHEGTHPELKAKVITPDVILQPHNASLELTFYTGHQFPSEYAGDIFASEHGSWNKSVRAGYELIRVPLHQTGHASGDYEDFLTGFVLDNGDVWGRPVGVAVATDGSLLVSDDGSNSIWRVSYSGK